MSSIQASSNALTLAGVTPVGVIITGSNPAMVMINDAGQIFNSRTGSLAISGGGSGVIITGDLYAQRLNVGIVTPYGIPNLVGATTNAGQTSNVISIETASSGLDIKGNLIFATLAPSSASAMSFATQGVVTCLAPTTPVNFTSTTVAMTAAITIERSVGTISGLQTFRSFGVRYAAGVSSAAVTQIFGIVTNGLNVANSTSTGPSSVTTLAGIVSSPLSIQPLTSPISITTCAAFYALNNGYPATTTVGNQIGLLVEAMSLPATINSGIKINTIAGGTSSNYGLWFNANGTTVAAGIAWGTTGDVSLYRTAASVLETPGDMRMRHPRSTTTPTIAAGAGAGTTPTLAISGTDMAFSITLTQGTPTATGIIATVTFGNTWTTAPHAVFCASDPDSAALTGTSCPYITTTATTLVFQSGSVGLVAGTQYIWKFVCGPAN